MMNPCAPSKITVEGWLRRQLEIEAAGLMGNLDKVWPDVRDSAWIGGNRDGWERVPYWLDAFVPMAYLLGNEDMIARADRYIQSILDRQQEDGWICPCKKENIPNYDLWAVFLIGKVLALYAEFTDSQRAIDGLYRAMKNLYELLENGTVKLFAWGQYRWFEGLIPIKFLHDRFKEDWLIALSAKIEEQGADYGSFEELWKTPLNKWTYETHIVNLGMMLKIEALTRALLGKSKVSADKQYNLLKRYNGTAVGIFTGDECLSGISAIQGTELCAVVEQMYSCEWLYRVTGNSAWMDRLELMAFNAQPATFSDDMWTHQYVQMANQISCRPFPGKSLFRTNGGEAHLFGLEPNFGCCTANGGQGWPKLAMHIFFEKKNAIVCPMMLPASLHTEMKGSRVELSIKTEYPFRHHGEYTVSVDKPVKFALQIRIPGWAEGVTVNGQTYEGNKYVVIDKVWEGSETVSIAFVASPKLLSRPYAMKAASWGPLVFSLPIETEWKMREYEHNGVERKFPYCDYSLIPHSDWAFGYADAELTVEEREGDDVPFSSKAPRVVLKANLAPIDWRMADGYAEVCAKTPYSRAALADASEMELYPYGCAKLRMTEMPMVNKKG